MRLFLAFLVAAFAIGATPVGQRIVRRPIVVFLACAVVGSLFYSYRFIE
jgi:hypothetical protein